MPRCLTASWGLRNCSSGLNKSLESWKEIVLDKGGDLHTFWRCWGRGGFIFEEENSGRRRGQVEVEERFKEGVEVCEEVEGYVVLVAVVHGRPCAKSLCTTSTQIWTQSKMGEDVMATLVRGTTDLKYWLTQLEMRGPLIRNTLRDANEYGCADIVEQLLATWANVRTSGKEVRKEFNQTKAKKASDTPPWQRGTSAF